MKSVVTAWKAENLAYNVQLPVFYVVFLLFLSRVSGRQKLGCPVTLSHECREQWFLFVLHHYFLILGPKRKSEQTLGIFVLGQVRASQRKGSKMWQCWGPVGSSHSRVFLGKFAVILHLRNSINAMPAMFMCYLDLSMSCSLHCRAGGCFDYILLCQMLTWIIILNSYWAPEFFTFPTALTLPTHQEY